MVHESVAAATHAADAALDEIGRVEALLSRFDSASEISRVNRNAARQPVVVDREIFRLLCECLTAWQDTQGAFDIAAGSRSVGTHGPLSLSTVQLSEAQHSVQFLEAGLRLDLGGCGKGYALDCAGMVLRASGVTRACLHAGTSSVLALGTAPRQGGWPIAIVDSRERQTERHRCSLSNRGLSTSAVIDAEAAIIDPRTQRPITGPRSCTVVARSAFLAEVWSTAGVVLGSTQLAELISHRRDVVDRVFWAEDGQSLLMS